MISVGCTDRFPCLIRNGRRGLQVFFVRCSIGCTELLIRVNQTDAVNELVTMVRRNRNYALSRRLGKTRRVRTVGISLNQFLTIEGDAEYVYQQVTDNKSALRGVLRNIVNTVPPLNCRLDIRCMFGETGSSEIPGR